MRLVVGRVVDQMTPEVRKQAEEEAERAGVSLEKFVERQIAVQITADELRFGLPTSSEIDWGGDISADATRDGWRVGGGIRVRF